MSSKKSAPKARKSAKSKLTNTKEEVMTQDATATAMVANDVSENGAEVEVQRSAPAPSRAVAKPDSQKTRPTNPTAQAIDRFANKVLPNLVLGRGLLATVRGGMSEDLKALGAFINEAMSRLQEAATRGTDKVKIAQINRIGEDLSQRYWKRFWDFVHNELHVFKTFKEWLRGNAPRTYKREIRRLEDAELKLTDALAEEKGRKNFEEIASATAQLRTLREEINLEAGREANKAFATRAVRASATDALAAMRALVNNLNLGIETETEEE
jgi:hypothetical protein